MVKIPKSLGFMIMMKVHGDLFPCEAPENSWGKRIEPLMPIFQMPEWMIKNSDEVFTLKYFAEFYP